MDPLFKNTYFVHDERSLLLKRVSPEATAGTAYFDHDAAGRVVTQFFEKAGGGADAPIYFTYDPVGNLTLVEDDSGADTVQEWDKLDRLEKKVNVAGPVYFEWDSSSKRAQTKNPSLDKVDNFYDDVGRLEVVKVNAARHHYYHYDDSDMPTKKLLAGSKVQSYYVWDDAGRLERLDNLDKTGAVLSYFHYTRNAVGAEVFVRHESDGLSYFEHDALDRLTHERRVASGARNFDKTFEYDATSNRSLEDDGVSGETVYFTYNAANLLSSTSQLPTANPVVFEYDDAQRMTAEKDAGDQSTYFSYDQRDQPIQLLFKEPGGLQDDTREFTFTGTGERAIVKTDTTPSYFAYDGSKLLEQRDTAGAAVFTYRHNDSFLDSMGSILEIDQAAGSLLFFPGFDQNGSTVTFVEDGGVFGPYESAYDFFGSVIFSDMESDQQARAFSPVMLDLDLDNTQIMASAPGGGLLLTPLVLFAPRLWPGTVEKSGDEIFVTPWLGPQVDRCGATVDKWLVEELKAQQNQVKSYVKSGQIKDLDDYLNYALMNQRYKERWRYPFSGSTNCGTRSCRNTVTLCGKCISTANLGNFVYGYVGSSVWNKVDKGPVGGDSLVTAPTILRDMTESCVRRAPE